HDHRGQSRAGGVGGRRGGGVACRGTDDTGRAALERTRDRDRHAAILEAACRVRALPLQPELAAETLREARRITLAEGYRHPSSATPRSEITGIADAPARVSSSASISVSATRRRPS